MLRKQLSRYEKHFRGEDVRTRRSIEMVEQEKSVYDAIKNMSIDEFAEFFSEFIDKEWLDDAVCQNGCEHDVTICQKNESCIYSGNDKLALKDILNWSPEKFYRVLELVRSKRKKREELLKG